MLSQPVIGAPGSTYSKVPLTRAFSFVQAVRCKRLATLRFDRLEIPHMASQHRCFRGGDRPAGALVGARCCRDGLRPCSPNDRLVQDRRVRTIGGMQPWVCEHNRRSPLRVAGRAGVVVATVLAAAVPASSALAVVRWFHSPTRNIQCEVSGGRPRGVYAYCVTFRTPKHVVLRANGRMATCFGIRCLSNGPENAFTLRYGRSTNVGPFRCTSRVTGMRCVVRRTGRGFLISRASLRRF